MTIIKLARIPSAKRNCPHRLRSAGRIARRIRRLPRRVLLSPARIDNRVPVFRKSELAELLPIVLQIRGQPPRFEFWRLRDPDVPFPVVVERPRNAIRFLRSHKISRKRRGEHLLKRERFGGLRLRLTLRVRQDRETQLRGDASTANKTRESKGSSPIFCHSNFKTSIQSAG